MVVDVEDVEGCGDVCREGAEWKDVETSEASDSESDFCSRSSTLARDSFLCVCEVLVILVIDVINF